MTALTNFAETTLINSVLRGVSFVPPASLFVALHTSDPTETGTANEVAGGGYTRQPVTFSAPTDGAAPSSVLVSFTVTGVNIGQVTHCSIWDAVSSGNAWLKGPLRISLPLNDGDVIRFDVAALVGSLA